MRTYVVCDPDRSGEGTLADVCIESCKANNILVEKFGIFHGFVEHLTNNNLKLPEDNLTFGCYFKIQPDLYFDTYTDVPLVRLGVIGCFLSHFYLWKKCIELNEPILILEHDAEIIRNIDWLNELDNSDWDMIHLDPCISYLLEGFDQYGSTPYLECVAKINPETGILPLDPNHSCRFDLPGFGFHMSGTYGYIITPRGASKVVEWVLANHVMPSDICLNGNRLNVGVTTNSYVKIQDRMSHNPFAQSSTLHSDYSKDTLREWALWVCYKRGIVPLEENIIQIINKSLTRHR
jgi:GR25 family glycosyltransferase involved in LPS biosynthesis